MLSDAELVRVEAIAVRHIATRSRDFPALRASGVVPLDLLSRGALEHPNSRIRRFCLILLDHLGDDRHIDVFTHALRADPVPRNRRHALHALTCNRCKATESCVDVTKLVQTCASTDPNDKVRQMAASLLS